MWQVKSVLCDLVWQVKSVLSRDLLRFMLLVFYWQPQNRRMLYWCFFVCFSHSYLKKKYCCCYAVNVQIKSEDTVVVVLDKCATQEITQFHTYTKLLTAHMRDKPTTQAPYTSVTHLTMLQKVKKKSLIVHESGHFWPLEAAKDSFSPLFNPHVLCLFMLSMCFRPGGYSS